jgi:hypothetical protein
VLCLYVMSVLLKIRMLLYTDFPVSIAGVIAVLPGYSSVWHINALHVRHSLFCACRPDGRTGSVADCTVSRLTVCLCFCPLQQDCPNGRLTPAKFVDMYKMFFPSGNAEEFCDHVFRTFDMDKNGYIDFKVSSFYCSMFCWPCIIVHQYSETNVMHFLFNLLRINGLYMFRALLADSQEALHKFHFNPGAANWHNTHAVYKVPLVKRLLRMSKWCSKYIQALNS